MTITTTKIGPIECGIIHESVIRVFDADTYNRRIARVLELGKDAGYSHIIVYGDREHFANIHYFTGYDPRFEEALLILSEGTRPMLMVGNEGVHYATIIPYEIDLVLYQSFSLAGQARNADTHQILENAARKAGVGERSKIGLIGWKYFVPVEGQTPRLMYDVPHYIVEGLKAIVPGSRIENACELMIDPVKGMRTSLDIDELAILELAGTKSSRSVYRLLSALRPGMSEIEASSHLRIDGDPLVAHPNVNFTREGIQQGLTSPAQHPLVSGSVCNVGFGYRSSMVARTGVYCHGREELKGEYANVWDRVLSPYFKVVAVWYESIGIGISGKDVITTIKRQVPEFDELGIGLNPGHLIHNDEWTTSVFTELSNFPLRSGMALQCDIIASPKGLPGTHVEDGLALADKNMRDRFKTQYPQAWDRIERRRKVMRDEIGLNIRDEVLPFSDIQGLLFPWMADLGTVMAVR